MKKKKKFLHMFVIGISHFGCCFLFSFLASTVYDTQAIDYTLYLSYVLFFCLYIHISADAEPCD